MDYIKPFKTIRLTDIPQVGGKNASLGEMIVNLSNCGIQIPDGFAITAQAYWYFIEYNHYKESLQKELRNLTNLQDLSNLEAVGSRIRQLIENGTMPDDLTQEIVTAYKTLSTEYNQQACDVAVRSSATAEDLPTASFAGQQETFLQVRGEQQLITCYKKCLASLFTDRAIVYRVQNGFDHFKVALSVGIQKMIRSDLASAGVAFSLDTETGFKDVVMINGSWGLGEMVVQGLVTPDEFCVHKPTLAQGFAPIIKKQRGDKNIKMMYDETKKSVTKVPTSAQESQQLCLTDKEIIELSKQVVTIENYYSKIKDSWSPMDVEWAKDGLDGKLYIVQARPETIHALPNRAHATTEFHLTGNNTKKILVTGQSIGQQIASGTVRVIANVTDINQVQQGDIIVTTMTDPDWVPAMKRASGIITERGGRTCHAAIVSRELGIPAIIGASNATQILKTGQSVTLDCSSGSVGSVYDGILPFEKQTIAMDDMPSAPIPILVNIADPNSAFKISQFPVSGVGLARIEFIIANAIQIHPMALIHPERITDNKILDKITQLTAGYTDKKQFFIDTLSQGIGMIAAAFYPHKVIVRLSDFKTNEYHNLIGGEFFEQAEDNPMLGFRGASRYYNPRYQDAFALECAALVKARNIMGLSNIAIMIPFVRTVNEAEKVIAILSSHGLARNSDLQLVMMVEIPSNVLLIEEFSAHFDGFSIGSNDLTQLTLGVDRDSDLLAPLFDERDPAVKKMMSMAITGARKADRFIGICGQAPSDYPELAQFLIDAGISSISLNYDAVIPFLMRYKNNKK